MQYVQHTRTFETRLVFDENGRQGRCKGQCHQGRKTNRDRHRQGKLLVDLAGKTAQERYRHKHGRHDKRSRNNRAAHLFHCSDGGITHADVIIFTQHTLNVFHHQNGIVHDDPDRQHQRKQCQQVD